MESLSLFFPMYSCSHFSEFLSDDQVRKQSAMSKRGQKTTSNESSPTAKAKPCLVLREQRGEEISSRCLGYLVNPWNADERKDVVQASKQLVQPELNSEVGYSQASRQENDQYMKIFPFLLKKLGMPATNVTLSMEAH